MKKKTYDLLPDHKKFGYDYMIEMHEIEEQLLAEGVQPGVGLHFKAITRYQENHKNDPSFAERCVEMDKRWRANAKPSQFDIFKIALEEIRDGHNDPRSLAREVLGEKNDQ